MKPRMTAELRSGGLTVVEPELPAQQVEEAQPLGALHWADIKSRVEAAGGVYTTKSAGIKFLRGQENAG